MIHVQSCSYGTIYEIEILYSLLRNDKLLAFTHAVVPIDAFNSGELSIVNGNTFPHEY